MPFTGTSADKFTCYDQTFDTIDSNTPTLDSSQDIIEKSDKMINKAYTANGVAKRDFAVHIARLYDTTDSGDILI